MPPSRLHLGARLRIGVVGCGAVAERYHLPALLASPDVAVTALADANPARAAALAAQVSAAHLASRHAGGEASLRTTRHPGAETSLHAPPYTGATDAGAPPLIASHHAELIGQVDAVVLTAPNAVHETIAVDFLQAGVAVLVEKPMARSAAECDRMLAAADASGAVLAVGHDFRYFPVAQFAKAFFAAGLLGGVRRVDARQGAGGRWPYASPAVLSPAAGGGVLLDFGVHLFDLLAWWLGPLRPRWYRDDAAGGIDGECEGELELPNGAPVQFELSRGRSMRDTVIVEGERGTIEIGVFEPAVVRLTPAGNAMGDSFGGMPGKTISDPADDTSGHVREGNATAASGRETGSAAGHPPTLAGAVPDDVFHAAPLRTVFARQLDGFVAAVRGQRPPPVSGAEGRQAVALAEACYAIKAPWRQPWDYPEAFAVRESAPLRSDALGPDMLRSDPLGSGMLRSDARESDALGSDALGPDVR